MKTYKNPSLEEWENLSQRSSFPTLELEDRVRNILSKVKLDGDKALKEFTLQFDQVKLENLKVSFEEIEISKDRVSLELKEAINIAAKNIRLFHSSQKSEEKMIETMPGVTCWRKDIGIENVGLYIPGGSAPLFSTILMLGIPAQIAGCKRIVLCTPVNKDGFIHPAILYTASTLGITEIYKVGGAQAIAALAYGTESIVKVDKIFGPGNQYVTKAKELIQQSGVAIDLPAGPSEVLVIADSKADSDFIASDLLSQAEHGPDSQVVFLTNDSTLIAKVEEAIESQLQTLPRNAIATSALENSFSIVFNTIDECLDFSNIYAPEHLIIAVEKFEAYISKIQNAGSVFLGNYTCESAGDYASGTDHTLFARTSFFAFEVSEVLYLFKEVVEVKIMSKP